MSSDLEEALRELVKAWRDNAAATDYKLVKALINPMAELGRVLARENFKV